MVLHGADRLYALIKNFESVAIAGLSKGCGKTAVLSGLIGAYKRSGSPRPVAVTSVGRGASVYIYKGMYAATAAGLIKDCDFTKRIICGLDMGTPLGEVLIVEALSDGYAALAGPSINSQLAALCRYLRTECGVSQTLVDGAGDRRAFTSPEASDATVLCVGGGSAAGDYESLRHACAIIGLPEVSRDILKELTIGNKKEVRGVVYDYINGALTDAAAEFAIRDYVPDSSRTALIAADSSAVFISPAMHSRLKAIGADILTVRKTVLAAIAVNPVLWGSDKNAVIRLMEDAADVPALDVREGPGDGKAYRF